MRNKHIERRVKTLCQCPVSGGPHFYEKYEHTIASTRTVSMPCLGRTSFLHSGCYDHCPQQEQCQCPVSGGPHFYFIEAWHYMKAHNVVSMPCLGRTSFLPCSSATSAFSMVCVNALSRADLISTCLRAWGLELPKEICVNALSRADLISTLPLRESSVYAGLRACFCR